MRTTRLVVVLLSGLCAALWWADISGAAPLGTAFTYQGRLIDSNEPANGSYDFQFRLYDANSEGSQRGADANVPEVDVVDGYFTVELDFGSGVFDGNDCWLEMAVRPGEQSEPNTYTTLVPRQKMTAAPHALYARTAEGIKGGIGWDMVANKPAGFADGIDDVGLVSESDPQVSLAVANMIAKWNGTTLIDSGIYESGGKVGIGTSSPTGRFEVVNFLPSGTIAEDQAQTYQDTEYSSSGVWQTFTAGATGALTHISLVTRDPYEICVFGICGWNPASATIRIYTGEGASGTPIATQAISITGGGGDGNTWAWMNYAISARPYLVSGQKYTFYIFFNSSTNDRSWCRYASSGDHYPVGQCSMGAGRDLEFKTYMDSYTYQPAIIATTGGSIGIGTSAPTQKLDVVGNAVVSGDVGIGTTSPTQKLDVNGTAKATAFVGDGSGLTNLPLQTEVDPQVSSSTANSMPRWNGAALVDSAVYDSGGNIGIGTTSPTAVLDVNGIAKVQGKQVAVGEENLRIIRGTVSVGGGVLAGSGFSATHPGTGFYHVTFDTAFSARPSVTATWKYQDADDFGATGTSSNVYTICVIAVDSTHFRIKTQGTSGGAVNVPFEFTAVGPR